ncbi:hypothetical protein ACIPZF_01300 [Pseudomonas sp. NPDC089752]|uniref:hypothetical protein n=1 Tax=Pseudomonas sp. NPDC089752 TaxID=3364472 RepID=UPI003820C4DC
MLALPRSVYRDQGALFLSVSEYRAELELAVDDDDCSTPWSGQAGAVHDQDIVLVDAESSQSITVRDPKPNVRCAQTDEFVDAERALLVIASWRLEASDLELFGRETQALDAAALKMLYSSKHSKILYI